jgi:hypothetical protein
MDRDYEQQKHDYQAAEFSKFQVRSLLNPKPSTRLENKCATTSDALVARQFNVSSS